MHAVITRPDPAAASPDIAVHIRPDAVRESRALALDLRIDEQFAVAQLRAVHVVLLNRLGQQRIVRGAGVADVELLVVRRKTETVRFMQIVGDHRHLPGLAVDVIHRFLHLRLVQMAFIRHQDAVAGVREPDAAIGMHHHVIRRVQRLPLPFVGQHGHRTIGFITNQPPRVVFAG